MLKKIENWLDTKMVPAWRVWWKLWSMRLGALGAAALTYLTAFPKTFADALSMLPPWLHDSLPAWIGPSFLAVLFFARFWNQSHATQIALPEGPEHGAE